MLNPVRENGSSDRAKPCELERLSANDDGLGPDAREKACYFTSGSNSDAAQAFTDGVHADLIRVKHEETRK